MFDVHIVPSGWGLCPTLFGVSSYALFVLLGIAAGAAYYFWAMRGARAGGEKAALIVLAALLGGAIGAKIPVLFLNFQLATASAEALTSGKTVLGGLLGGFLGVILVKKLCHIKGRYGNVIAPAAALGLAVGRVGCLLAGCCFGKPTGGGWGLNFGDGVLRWPTQLLELLFHLAAFAVLLYLKKRVHTPGILFKGYVLSYLIFRYFTEFLRVSDVLWAGQTAYQLLCIAGVLLVGTKLVFLKKKEKTEA